MPIIAAKSAHIQQWVANHTYNISNSDYEHPYMDGYCKNHLHFRVQLRDDSEAIERKQSEKILSPNFNFKTAKPKASVFVYVNIQFTLYDI